MIAAGDHGRFVVCGCCASGGRGEGDGPDPWVRHGSEGKATRARAGRAGRGRAEGGALGRALGPS